MRAAAGVPAASAHRHQPMPLSLVATGKLQALAGGLSVSGVAKMRLVDPWAESWDGCGLMEALRLYVVCQRSQVWADGVLAPAWQPGAAAVHHPMSGAWRSFAMMW